MLRYFAIQLGNCVEIGIPMLLLVIGLSQVSVLLQVVKIIPLHTIFVPHLRASNSSLIAVSKACEAAKRCPHFRKVSCIDLRDNHLDLCTNTDS